MNRIKVVKLSKIIRVNQFLSFADLPRPVFQSNFYLTIFLLSSGLETCTPSGVSLLRCIFPSNCTHCVSIWLANHRLSLKPPNPFPMLFWWGPFCRRGTVWCTFPKFECKHNKRYVYIDEKITRNEVGQGFRRRPGR